MSIKEWIRLRYEISVDQLTFSKASFAAGAGFGAGAATMAVAAKTAMAATMVLSAKRILNCDEGWLAIFWCVGLDRIRRAV